jgi:hypothetical protein
MAPGQEQAATVIEAMSHGLVAHTVVADNRGG